MSEINPILHLVCGKIAAGKSTLAARLASEPSTVLIGEDTWLSRLYPGEIRNIDDYVRCAGRLQDVMGRHVEELLRNGVSVVLDFPANTVSARRWMHGIIENACVEHVLHYVDIPDSICKARLRQRNENATHEFATSETDFDLITSFFVAPTLEEGFNVIVYSGPD